MPRQGAARSAGQQQLERPSDFDRLPKRFKDYILHLEGRVHYADKLFAEQTDSLVWLETYSLERIKRNLSSDARVRFKTTSGIIEVQLDARRDNGGLEVSAPDGRLFVLSEASNVIGVKVGRS